MAYSGATEIAAINAALEAMPEPWYEGGLADDQAPPVDWSGAPTAYRVVIYGAPVPLVNVRALGEGEKTGLMNLPVSILHVAPTATAARELRQDSDAQFLDWSPNPPNSGEMKSRGGNTGTVYDTDGKPSHFRAFRYYDLYINATNDGAA